MTSDKYKVIFKNYEKIAKEEHEDTKRVGWNNQKRAEDRYQYILEQASSLFIECDVSEINLLDIGCGLCLLYQYLKNSSSNNIKYHGIDISQYYITESASMYSDINLLCSDILVDSLDLSVNADVAVLNGVFTQKFDLSQSEMDRFLVNMILATKKYTKKMILFNVMSPHVDYRLNEAYHVDHKRMIDMMLEAGISSVVINEGVVAYEYFVRAYV